METLERTVETFEGEHLKSLTEASLHWLAKTALGRSVIEIASGGKRIDDPRLHTSVAGLDFDNPIMVGAGWDKKGRCIDGLYSLGFSGVEVGSVLAYPQAGNPKPRLWTSGESNGVGLNRMGFNSPGMETVAKYLANQARPGVTGISLGKNKLQPNEHAPWAHAVVAERLHDFADYFVINVASPNTPGLRSLLSKEPLSDMVKAVKEVLAKKGSKPLFIKTTVDLSLDDLDSVLEVCEREKVTGVIDTNTTIEDNIKNRYGWAGQMGGVNGNDPDYRKKATDRMKHITKETQGTDIQRIGVGGINNSDHALERLQAGAQILQVVTGIRQRSGMVARDINLGLLAKMNQDGTKNISEYVGTSVN